jgi:exonuclease III
MSFRKDFEAIKDSGADIIFIQECEELPQDYFPGYEYHWVGNKSTKGMAVLTRGASTFEKAIYRDDFIYFIPISYNGHAVIGTWAYNGRAKKFGDEMSGYFLEVLAHYQDWINKSHQVLIAGDFNNGPQWDKPKHPNNFVDINQELNRLGLTSSYHAHTGEEFGAEAQHTYFHHRHADKKYHIDYVYSKNKVVESVEVGNFDDWSHLSDHVPLITTFAN